MSCVSRNVHFAHQHGIPILSNPLLCPHPQGATIKNNRFKSYKYSKSVEVMVIQATTITIATHIITTTVGLVEETAGSGETMVTMTTVVGLAMPMVTLVGLAVTVVTVVGLVVVLVLHLVGLVPTEGLVLLDLHQVLDQEQLQVCML